MSYGPRIKRQIESDEIFLAEERARAYNEKMLEAGMPLGFDLTTGTLFDEDGDDWHPIPIVAASEAFLENGDFVELASYYEKGQQQIRLGKLGLQFLHGRETPEISYATSRGGSGAFVQGLNLLKDRSTPYVRRYNIVDAAAMPFIMTRPKFPNHPRFLRENGYTNIREVSHLMPDGVTFNIDGLIKAMRKAERATLLLQTDPPNPLGKNPTIGQWHMLADELLSMPKKSRHTLILDTSIPGIAHSVREDTEIIRAFSERGLEFFNSVSLSKIFGIPGWQTGLLCHVHPTNKPLDEKEIDLDTIAIRNKAELLRDKPEFMGNYLITHALELLPGVMHKEIAKVRDRIYAVQDYLIDKIPEFATEFKGEGHLRCIKTTEDRRVAFEEKGIFPAPIERQNGHVYLRFNFGRLPPVVNPRLQEFTEKFREVMFS